MDPLSGKSGAPQAELTPKPLERTTQIMAGLLLPLRYAHVIYLTAPAARAVVKRAAAELPHAERAQVVIRDLPPYAFTPEEPS